MTSTEDKDCSTEEAEEELRLDLKSQGWHRDHDGQAKDKTRERDSDRTV